MNKDQLIETLKNIDEEVSLTLDSPAYKPVVVIVGGASFMLRDLTSRQVTHDIDVLSTDDIVRGVLAHYPNVNENVGVYNDQIPYNFEDRLVDLPVETQVVRFVSPSAEDLIVMKLYAERPNDIQDIDAAAQQNLIDWELLEHLVYDKGEARASTNIDRRYNEMVDAYERFKERSKK